MANDQQYAEAIRKVKDGTATSWDRAMTERMASCHNHKLQAAAKEALGK